MTGLPSATSILPIKIPYNLVTRPPIQWSYCKEALTNINKHSNASLVSMRFSELKNKWTLLILDNGNSSTMGEKSLSGIGLINIEERVDAMGGTLHINDQNGFRIFISILKRG